MKKKFFSILIIFFVAIICCTNVHASEDLIHIGVYDYIYKLSERGTKISLPFLNLFGKAATYDEDVKNSGITLANSTVDVNEKLEGIQLMFSQDMVTIKGQVEHAIVYAMNIVIEGEILGDSLLIGNTVQIMDSAVISNDVIICCENLKFEGKINGNLIAKATNTAEIKGDIGKELRLAAKESVVSDGQIDGKIYIETDSNLDNLKETYPKAVIVPFDKEDDEEIGSKIISIILKGVLTVVVYSFACHLLTRKENNFVSRSVGKFKNNSALAILISTVSVMLLIVLPILLVILGAIGFGIIAWPVLIAYIGIMLFVMSTSTLIVGSAIYEVIKNKVSKHKVVAIAIIFTLLYALNLIPYVAVYASIVLYLIALAIVLVNLTRTNKNKQITVEENKQD